MARVLIADDEPSMRDVFAQACETQGHEAHAVADADAAVAAFLGFAPQVLILDLHMSGGGSREILDRLEPIAGGRACPAIVTSGDSLEELESQAAAHPWIRATLKKPFRLSELAAALHEALRYDS